MQSLISFSTSGVEDSQLPASAYKPKLIEDIMHLTRLNTELPGAFCRRITCSKSNSNINKIAVTSFMGEALL